MLLLFLTLSSLCSVLATPHPGCPAGYVFLNDNQCVKFHAERKSYNDSVQACRDENAHLVSVHNAIDNRRLVQLIGNLTQPVWLGLTCNSPVSYKNCQFDDSEYLYLGEYQNFAPGNPSVPEPITIIPFGKNAGRWYSADGEKTLAPFFCEKLSIDTCPFTNGSFCYTPYFPSGNILKARKICQAECGDLVSIHSAAENDFIVSISSEFISGGNKYVFIGARLKSWMDESVWNYDNVGYMNPDIGVSMGMAISGGAGVRKGEWMSLDETANFPFICKTRQGVKCGDSLPPTSAPLVCGEGQFLSGNGTIYSPNYPYSYTLDRSPCSYTIIAHQHFHPFIEFSEFMLDPDSFFSIYDAMEDHLITNLSASNPPKGRITSKTNILRVEFLRFSMDNTLDYEWKAEYGVGNN